jgi:hypothetical protein
MKSIYYRRPNVSSYLVKGVAVFLYFSFFIVQLFFNFGDNYNSNPATFFNSYSLPLAGHQFQNVKQANKGKGTRDAIRLNKRFEPKVIAMFGVVEIRPMVRYFEISTFSAAASLHIAAPFFLAQSFRGPPAVA